MAAPPQVFAGRFVVEREVGRGGGGLVYRAVDRATGFPVALKVVDASGIDASGQARFHREGRILATLRHPNIVRVVAFGQLDEGQPYIAMEWLDGEDVARRQRREPMRLGEAVSTIACVCDALAAAHGAGVVHRDVKPSNIVLVGGAAHVGVPPAVKLVDFGVAAVEDVRLTRTGAIVGTPAYMAPEQARGEGPVDARADLYAVGATLFEMIAGRPPHVGPTPVAILARLVTTPAPRLVDVLVDAPPRLDALVSRLLATAPADRPASAADVAAELRGVGAALGADAGRPTHGARGEGGGAPDVSTARSSGTRFVTSIVATSVPEGDGRAHLLEELRSRGAEAAEIGRDAVVAHLGVHRASGDEAVRALDLALDAARLGASVGVATGRSKVERTRPTGEVVDRAAALARDATPGAALADTTTAELTRGRFALQWRPNGSAIVGDRLPGRPGSTGGAPFVGRDAELAQVVAAFERCAEDRTPILVSVSGAAGSGKTRLCREAFSRLTSRSTTPRVLHARCEPFAQGHALGVAADVARALAGVPKGAALPAAYDAVDALLASGEPACSPVARDFLAHLIADEALPAVVDSRESRDALWLALTDMVAAFARSDPVVIAVEDAHWADRESLGWLDHVLGRAGASAVCVVAAARPELWRDEPALFDGRDHVRVELRPLSRRHACSIVKALLASRGEGAQGEALAESIALQSAGVPLFAEELARAAAAGRDPSRAPTIESAMQAQLDSLEDFARVALCQLAVFGRTGWDLGLDALGVVCTGDALRELSAAEVIVEQAHPRFAGAREYAFKHAAMREVAYASLDAVVLRHGHARAGRWLASVGEDSAVVARHLELGGDRSGAAVHMEKAARRALAAHCLPDAVSLAEKALGLSDDQRRQFACAQLLDEAWSRLDARAAERDTAVEAMQETAYDDASRLRASGARVRYEDARGGGSEVTTSLDQVRLEAQRLGVVDEEARCAAALAARCAYAGALDQAAEVAGSLVELARRHEFPGAAVDAWQTLAVVHQERGDMVSALEARRAAARAASAAGLKAREAMLTVNVGFALSTVGDSTEARLAIEHGIELARAIGSPGIERHGKMVLLCWAATFGSDEAIDRELAETRSTAAASLGSNWVPRDRATLGIFFYRALELLRAPDGVRDARELLRIAAQGYRATNMLDVLPAALGRWAEAERRCGEAERAFELAAEAAALLDGGSPSLLNEAPIYLALHDAAVDGGRFDEARAAVARGLPLLVRRARGLAGTAYEGTFLRRIDGNSGLLAAAARYGLLPSELAPLAAHAQAK